MIEQIKAAFISRYGETFVDIKEDVFTKEADEINDGFTKTTLVITVLYPKIEIKDKKNNRIIIKDLFCRFSFKFKENTLSILNNIDLEGIRKTFSSLEYDKEVIHPYLSTGNLTRLRSFCLDAFNRIKAITLLNLNNTKTEQEISLYILGFLTSFENYLSYDSGAGFYRFYQISLNSVLPNPTTTLKGFFPDIDIKEYLKTNLESFIKVTFKKGIQIFIPNEEKIENLITSYLLEKLNNADVSVLNKLKHSYILVKKVGKHYSIIKENTNSNVAENKKLEILFKGQEIFITIDTENTLQIKEETVINPSITKKIYEGLEESLRKTIQKTTY